MLLLDILRLHLVKSDIYWLSCSSEDLLERAAAVSGGIDGLQPPAPGAGHLRTMPMRQVHRLKMRRRWMTVKRPAPQMLPPSAGRAAGQQQTAPAAEAPPCLRRPLRLQRGRAFLLEAQPLTGWRRQKARLGPAGGTTSPHRQRCGSTCDARSELDSAHWSCVCRCWQRSEVSCAGQLP